MLSVVAQEPKKDAPDGDYSAELPRLEPTEPAEAIKKFSIAPEFRVELVAAEPELASPVAMAFDEAGRIFVIEMRDYSEQDKEQLGRVRVLEDADGDGRYEKATVFAEGLSWPTAILCYDGGVFVGAAPDIYYMKDTDGDGKADEKQIVFTGFGRSNVQGLMNSFAWGPDNRVYVAVSSSGAQLKTPTRPDWPATDLRGRDLAFDPKTLKYESIAGGAQHGMTFTKWGERLVCSNSDHLQWISYDDSLAARNPFLSAPPARMSIAADGPQAEVFRSSPVEPWRLVRTRLRVNGVVPGMVEGGGRAAGYFTSATGVTAVTGTAFPEVDGEWVIVGDVGSNLVHRKKLTIENGMLRGVRVDEKSELLTSSDNWFRPVQFANGPDGAIYILDMYREVIEHPASLPPAIKKHLDLTSGRERGRIWRLVKNDFRRPRPRDLGKCSIEELIACLSDANGWTRTTAARLLYERKSEELISAVRESASRADLPPIGVVQHLWWLASIDTQEEAKEDLVGRAPLSFVAKCLQSPSAEVRLAAARVCERRMRLELLAPLTKLLGDENPLVRRSAAFAYRRLHAAQPIEPLVKLAIRDSGDPLTRYAVMAGFAHESGLLLRYLLADEAFRDSPARGEWVALLAAAVRRELDAPIKEIEVYLGYDYARGGARQADLFAQGVRESNLRFVGEAMRELIGKDRRMATELLIALAPASDSELSKKIAEATGGDSEGLIAAYLAEARAAASDGARPLQERIAAIGRLSASRFADEVRLLDTLLRTTEGSEIQVAAVDLAEKFSDGDVAPWLIAKWPNLTPAVRERALGALVARTAWVASLLSAIDEKRIAAVDIPPATRSTLLRHPSEASRKQAAAIFGQSTKKEREAILNAYRSALNGGGAAEKGKSLFKQHCSTCHQHEGVGNAVGPNLAAMKARGAEAILTNVIDPNREVLPQFLSYVAEMDDGRIVSGMIESESPTTIVLRKADGQKEELSRAGIESLKSTGQSLMPEGLEKQLDQAAMADLLAYLLKPE